MCVDCSPSSDARIADALLENAEELLEELLDTKGTVAIRHRVKTFTPSQCQQLAELARHRMQRVKDDNLAEMHSEVLEHSQSKPVRNFRILRVKDFMVGPLSRKSQRTCQLTVWDAQEMSMQHQFKKNQRYRVSDPHDCWLPI